METGGERTGERKELKSKTRHLRAQFENNPGNKRTTKSRIMRNVVILKLRISAISTDKTVTTLDSSYMVASLYLC